MTGRGIDQILPHPVDPRLHETGMPSARCYVERAARQHGALEAPVDFDSPWGALPEAIAAFAPALRLANFETVISTSDDAWPGKRYHFRMHPDNAPCLRAMRFDCLSLANNHVLDWGPAGLEHTVRSLHGMGIRTAGAGADEAEAAQPAVLALPGGGRVLVFAVATPCSHVAAAWAAGPGRPGVNLLGDFSDRSLARVAAAIAAFRLPGDLVVLSVHWGGNWGFDIPPRQREFAHRLVDSAGVDIVHGHSPHHVQGIEVHRGKLIIYGCGDLLNDYERIAGQAEFLHDQSAVFLPVIARDSGRLVALAMLPTRIRRMRVDPAGAAASARLEELLDRECRKLGTRVVPGPAGCLALKW